MFEHYRLSPSNEWILAYRNSRGDLQFIADQFDVSDSHIDRIFAPSYGAQHQVLGDQTYYVIHVPHFDFGKQMVTTSQVHFIIQRDRVLTILEKPQPEIEELRKRLVADPHSLYRLDSWQVAIELLACCMHQAAVEAQKLLEYVSHYDDRLSKQTGLHAVKSLAQLNRSCLELKRLGFEYDHVADALRRNIKQNHDRVYWFDTLIPDRLSQFRKITNISHDLAKELKDTHNAVLSSHQSETMKLFTVISFITFPTALLLDILKVQHTSNPLTHLSYEFWVLVGITVVVVTGMVSYFKRKGWL